MERIYDSCEKLIDIYIVFYDKRQQETKIFCFSRDGKDRIVDT